MKHPFSPVFKQSIWRIVMSAVRLPIFYLIIGISFIVLGYIDLVVTNPAWEHFLDYSTTFGHIFISLALLRFIYNLMMFGLKQIEIHFSHSHHITALVLRNIRQSLLIIYYLTAINVIINILEPTKFYLNLSTNVIHSIMIISIGWMVIQVVNTVEAVLYQQFARHHVKNKELNALYTKTRIMKNIATVVIALISLAAILMSFNSVRSIGVSILASAGFLTAIVGLAMQKTLSSLFSGIQIALSQFVQIGDVVSFDNQNGIIEEITFTYVLIKCSDGRRLIVPISQFIDKPFENWSQEHHGLQSSIYLNLDYRIPISPIREQFTFILEESPHWNRFTKSCTVSELGQQTVKVRLQMSAKHSDALGDLLSEVREKMLTFLQEHYPDYLANQAKLGV